MNESMFHNLFLSTDVLSVASYSEYILAGIGNNLYVYDNDKLKLKSKIFNGERIHSIYVDKGIVLVKGCKELLSITLDDGCEDYRILCHIHCKDWIQDVFYDLKKKILVLATAHNVIEMWDIQSKTCLKSYVCEEKCILYSCKFANTNVEEFILMCGTVFSEIVIWAPLLPHPEDQPVLHRLKGHDGVIFSIVFSTRERIICSTSDDRSIRIWCVEADGPLQQRKTWKKANISLIHTLYGHTARVWKSLILSNCIVSAGEDSKICVWNKSGKLENSLDLHQESGIRGLGQVEGTECIVTGGEDGGITLLTPQRLLYHTSSSAERGNYNLNENAFGLPRKVAFLREKIICTTDRGYVLFPEGQSLVNVVYEDKEFSNYCLLEVSTCGRFLLLGSIKGRVVVIDSKTKAVHFDEKLIDGKIFSFHWLSDRVVICSSNGALVTYRVNLSPAFSLDKEKVFSLPSSKERWTTCALIHQNHVIIGDRMGSIHVYHLTSMNEDPEQSFSKVHGHLGVTHIIRDGDVILTSGRDGSVKQFHFSDRGITYSLKYKLPMEWPWRIVKCSGERLVLGFSSVYFVIWSLRKREILGKFDCGGGHRSFDFVANNDTAKLIYIRNKMVHFSELPLFHSFQIRKGFHGREINCLKILRDNPLIFVSGSEDTTLRVSGFKGNKIDQLLIIENHISSVRDLHVLAISENDRIFFSAGGRAQITVHKYNIEDGKYEEVEIYFLHESERKVAGPAVEGETRIMCVHSVAFRDVILVSAACSDRQIRVFSYQNRLKLLTSIPYSHCILKVGLIQLNSSLILLSMGTDGFIVFWDVTDIVSNPNSFIKIDSIRIHQSGINSFEIKDLKDGKLFLATGGDDNLISVLLFHLNKTEGVNILHEWRNFSTHSSQITGIKLLGNVLLTTSVDQRLTVWRCTIQGNIVEMKFIHQYISSVADIQGIQVVHKTVSSVLACLHGKGLEIIEIDITSLQQLGEYH